MVVDEFNRESNLAYNLFAIMTEPVSLLPFSLFVLVFICIADS